MKGLTDNDRRLIPCLMHLGEATNAELAKRSGLREHVVRYTKESLRVRDLLLQRTPFINPYPLGYTGNTLYVTLAGGDRTVSDKSSTQRMIAAIRRERNISWAAQLSGEFEFAIAFLSKHPDTVATAIAHLGSAAKVVFLDRQLTITLKFHAFVRKYLWPSHKALPFMYFGHSSQTASIDAVDHDILSFMASESYSSHRDVAHKLSLHHTLVDRRIRRLQESGVVSGFINHFDLRPIGAQTHRLLIVVAAPGEKVTKALLVFCTKHPRILRFIETLGSWDFEIELEVFSSDELLSVVQEMKDLLGSHLVRIRTTQILHHLTFVPLPPRS